MKLEVGKKYRLNNGEEHVCESGKVIGYVINGNCYTSTGKLGGFSQYDPRSVACEVTDDQYKPLSEFAPFKAGERFMDERGDVLEILPVCDRYDWVKIGKVQCEAEAPGMSVGLSLVKVTPLDREDDTPKLWGDMTDAEKGALLLAHHEGKVIEWQFPEKGKSKDWVTVPAEMYWNSGYAYRVRPEPSFLPLEAGKTYRTAERGDWECVYVRNGNAWMGDRDDTVAYVWHAETGKAKSLPEVYDIVGLASGDT